MEDLGLINGGDAYPIRLVFWGEGNGLITLSALEGLRQGKFVKHSEVCASNAPHSR